MSIYSYTMNLIPPSIKEHFKNFAQHLPFSKPAFSEEGQEKMIQWWTDGFRQAITGLREDEIEDFSTRLRDSIRTAIKRGYCMSPNDADAVPTFFISQKGKNGDVLKMEVVLYLHDPSNEHWVQTDTTYEFINAMTLLHANGDFETHVPDRKNSYGPSLPCL